MALLTPQRCRDPGIEQHGLEGVLLLLAGALPVQPFDRVVGDQVYLRHQRFRGFCQQSRLIQRVVHAGDQNEFKGQPLVALGVPVGQRFEQLLQRVLAVHRHDLLAHLVAGAVKRDRQPHLEREVGELLDVRGHAAGADRHVPGPDAHAPGGVQALDRAQEVGEVRQRLAHAHEHKVVDPVLHDFLHLHDLLHDFTGGEVAGEAREAAGAELAVVGAAHLAGDTQRQPVGGFAIQRRVRGNEHRLHIAAVVQLEEELPRGVVRAGHAGKGHGAQRKMLCQLLTKAPAQVRHLVKRQHPALEHPVQDLCGPIGGLLPFLEQFHQSGLRKAEDGWLGWGCGGGGHCREAGKGLTQGRTPASDGGIHCRTSMRPASATIKRHSGPHVRARSVK